MAVRLWVCDWVGRMGRFGRAVVVVVLVFFLLVVLVGLGLVFVFGCFVGLWCG